MEKGFATIEIICVTLIISILMALTIPNAARIVDRAALDYEYKHLYSNLRRLQALNHLERLNVSGLGRNDIQTTNFPVMQFMPGTRSWQIIRNISNEPVFDAHYTQRVVSITHNLNLPLNRITFSSDGRVQNTEQKALYGTIKLYSRFGQPNTIVFDTVGRFRGGHADE